MYKAFILYLVICAVRTVNCRCRFREDVRCPELEMRWKWWWWWQWVCIVGMWRETRNGRTPKRRQLIIPIRFSRDLEVLSIPLREFTHQKRTNKKSFKIITEILGIILINFKYTLDVILKSWYQNKVHVHILEFLWEMFKSKQKLYFEGET